MPRENRKRGKKHKKQQPDEENGHTEAARYQEQAAPRAGPSWIVERSAHGLGDGEQVNPDAPFGFVDPDVKAYFKTVDARLREWQEANDGAELDEGGDADPNEARRMFLIAALQELSGKEKQLATDPDCSIVLERMAYSMDDFVKRVLVDRLAGSFDQLSKHRFGSHVVQTLLSVAKGTICREAKGVFPPSPDDEQGEKEGHLPLLTQLIINVSDELLPSTTSLLMDPFASHVLRALLVLLCPALPSVSDSSSSNLRSKKSAKHRAKQGSMKSMFTDGTGDPDDTASGKGKERAVLAYSPEFESTAWKFVQAVRQQLGPNEVRALAADKVACPVLVLLLEMESLQGKSDETGSLMDSVSAGLISASLQTPQKRTEASDYVTTLLREPTSSHLLEKLVTLAPEPAFGTMWELYFNGKLSKLAVHPVANFVVARAVERANASQLSSVLEELQSVWPKIIKNARTGVLKALVDRSVHLKSLQEDVIQVIFDAFGLNTSEEQLCLIECMLYLKTYSEFQDVLELERETPNGEGKVPNRTSLAPPEPTVQGSVLVQSLLQLDAPYNQSAIQSLVRLPPTRLLAIAHHPISSRILDALLTTPSVPSNARRQLILAFQGHVPALVDDRIGSRVGERLWAAADPYLKEKIARGLIPHENELVGSRYGKFFMRGLNLFLLKRNPEEWKAQQVKAGAAKPYDRQVKPSTTGEPVAKRDDKRQKRKRADAPQDEIDVLFTTALGKRQKKGSLATVGMTEGDTRQPIGRSKGTDLSGDKELDSVLSAIRSAPKELKTSGKKKK